MWPEGGKVAVPCWCGFFSRVLWRIWQKTAAKRSLFQGGAHSHCDCRTSQAPSLPCPILHPTPKFGALLPMGSASVRWDGFCFWGKSFRNKLVLR